MWWFTSDEHYGHFNAIKHSFRPFNSLEEMNETIIQNHNSVVAPGDIVIHAGDFCWYNHKKQAYEIVKRLNGTHILLRGSHDHWMNNTYNYIWRKRIEGHLVVVCHYAMRTWECSHYNSWQLYGHSHGRLGPVGKQWDIGVDNNNYYPVSFEEIKEIMGKRPNNLNLVKEHLK